MFSKESSYNTSVHQEEDEEEKNDNSMRVYENKRCFGMGWLCHVVLLLRLDRGIRDTNAFL